MRSLKLKLVTTHGVGEELECNSVRLPLADGGSLGIRPGHIAALMALSEGKLVVSKDGEILYDKQISGGFASVDHDTVTILTEKDVPS